ncbi:DUF6916 family protein [Thalassomonas actiniarum]|uniref:DUF6916 domain-containing protein n=1 Tax=Thalassomonas actiniarum TaxID=485447 RepID=A0AAE9YNY1_9GAMM|nr:hypothetical protein [Thalassomonas actiniarum]WDD98525.1 hypothetical protein SG35_025265 [Thalassomonas actiniarum]
MDAYNYQQLSQLIGEAVQVSDQQGNQVSLKIIEVNKGQLDGEQWEAFSVIYTSDEAMNISQGTYRFSHQAFGQIDLFLSPNSAVEFETIVTRSRAQEAQAGSQA